MPFNGSGTYSLPAGNPVVTGTTISSTTTNTTNSDIATALTNCLTRDGQSTPSANLPMNSKKLTGLAAGTSNGDSVRYDEFHALDVTVSGIVSGLGGISVFTSSGTYTIPSGATKIKVTVVGAGGGGGKYASGSSGGNTTVSSGTQTISTITGGGGGGGLGNSYTPPVNDNGGVGTGGDINFSGSVGLGAYDHAGQSMFGNGGAAFLGGGGRGSYNNTQAGNGLVYGGGAGGTYGAQGGGGGGAAIKYLTVTGGNTLIVTIGAGGAGGDGTATGAQGVVVIEY